MNTKVDVLLGLQWGDEGKGKIVDVLTPRYEVIARFQGGPNAGHTLEFNGIKHVLHTIPSGIFHEGKKNVVGNGVVIDPIILKREIEALEKMGVDVNKQMMISRKAHLIMPTHCVLDSASEAEKGSKKIGSTLKGIGPTYMDKTGRNGLRVGDLFLDDFMDRYNSLKAKHEKILRQYQFEYDITAKEEAWFEGVEKIRSLKIIDSEHELNACLQKGETILAEGAQGSLLDIDFGSYPFVTSSNTIAAGACTGLGIAPNKIGEVIGIFKAYCTRVGSGPFPTELDNEEGERMRKEGNEFGATTGRPRRCGWIDIPALKYAIMINGVTQLNMTKADVLSIFDEIKVCTHYKYKGEVIDYLPYDLKAEDLSPVYESVPGWNTDLTGLRNEEDFPAELQGYIDYLEEKLQTPITVVSVGPDRSQTIMRKMIPA
jgi:adenylosuccinate synthase